MVGGDTRLPCPTLLRLHMNPSGYCRLPFGLVRYAVHRLPFSVQHMPSPPSPLSIGWLYCCPFDSLHISVGASALYCNRVTAPPLDCWLSLLPVCLPPLTSSLSPVTPSPSLLNKFLLEWKCGWWTKIHSRKATIGRGGASSGATRDSSIIYHHHRVLTSWQKTGETRSPPLTKKSGNVKTSQRVFLIF